MEILNVFFLFIKEHDSLHIYLDLYNTYGWLVVGR